MSSNAYIVDPDKGAVLRQFNHLIEELLSGNLHRSRFQPWEIDILVDMVSCHLPGAAQSAGTLREYQKVAERRIRKGARVPLKLSEYLQLQTRDYQFKPRRRKRAARAQTRVII
jgi:hypothetical protein